jgi:hypothetical protein
VWLENDKRADAVRNAFDQGVLNAASIGFRPVDSEPLPGGGQRFTAWEMLEFSLVPVPSNPGATRTLMKRLGLFNDEPVEFDAHDLADAMQTGIAEAVRSVAIEYAPSISRMVKNEIDRARGRVVDDDEVVLYIADPLDDPARRHKAGRVLSRANETRIRYARSMTEHCHKHLCDVLGSMGTPDDN